MSIKEKEKFSKKLTRLIRYFPQKKSRYSMMRVEKRSINPVLTIKKRIAIKRRKIISRDKVITMMLIPRVRSLNNTYENRMSR